VNRDTKISAERRARAQEPLRIVSIGGGTGLSTLLKGLKKHSSYHLPGHRPVPPRVEITAIVTVTDDGGSSGRLRREMDMLPPGDIRNCMAALAEDEGLLTRLFQYRFDAGRGLKGHSFGNLFLAVLTQITGDFSQAVQMSSEVLAIAGRIFPSTSSNVVLRATLADGAWLEGETRISRSRIPIRRIELKPQICDPVPAALEAIRHADLVTLGPGSLYTSIIPNLLVRGIPQAIQRSRAIKACFVNLMWQPGETTGMSAADHVRAIQEHAACRLVDFAVLNNQPIAPGLLRRYAREHALPVRNDLTELRAMGVRVVELPLLESGAKVRHSPDRIAAAAVELAKKSRRLQLSPRPLKRATKRSAS
jgi:uncharacterized cofD-like protein